MSKRHKHADLIHAWAEGAEIEVQKYDSTWEVVETPNWHATGCYRIKPKKPEWWESIPEHGVLCWVSDDTLDPRKGGRISIVYQSDPNKGFWCCDAMIWKYATHLTDDEIKQFLRGGE